MPPPTQPCPGWAACITLKVGPRATRGGLLYRAKTKHHGPPAGPPASGKSPASWPFPPCGRQAGPTQRFILHRRQAAVRRIVIFMKALRWCLSAAPARVRVCGLWTPLGVLPASHAHLRWLVSKPCSPMCRACWSAQARRPSCGSVASTKGSSLCEGVGPHKVPFGGLLQALRPISFKRMRPSTAHTKCALATRLLPSYHRY
mmetsp:Transcript_1341/g.3637  ORF Transcript_1341/g.3637 Transcript_1341/m.3637 type:complete len:202 (-) Transcript_1341:328-933(-)